MNKNYGWLYSNTGEIDEENQELKIHGHVLIAGEILYKKHQELFDTDDLCPKIERYIRKQLFYPQTRQRIQVSIVDNGEYGHELIFFSGAYNDMERIEYLEQIKQWLENGALATICDDIITPYCHDWQLSNGEFWNDTSEDYDNALERGLCIDNDDLLAPIDEVTSQELLRHIGKTSEPKRFEREHLLDLIKN